MEIVLKIEKSAIDTNLSQLRDFKEDFLRLAVHNESPADNPGDFLWALRVIENLDNTLINIIHQIEKKQIEFKN